MTYGSRVGEKQGLMLHRCRVQEKEEQMVMIYGRSRIEEEGGTSADNI